MRVLAILAMLALLAATLVAAVPVAAARVWEPPVHVEPVVCVTQPCPPMVWCDPQDTGGDVRYERFDDCSQRVSVDLIDCVWGETWVTNTVGPVTVRHTVCRDPPEPPATEQAPPCNGIAYVDRTVGPAHVYGVPGQCMNVDVAPCAATSWTTVQQGAYRVRVATCTA